MVGDGLTTLQADGQTRSLDVAELVAQALLPLAVDATAVADPVAREGASGGRPLSNQAPSSS
jgi:hypothetical protein